MVTEAKAALELHIPHQTLLVDVRKRSRIAPLLMGSSITWRKKLASMQSRNFLDCLCPDVLSLQKIPRLLKSPMRTRACECESAPIYL